MKKIFTRYSLAECSDEYDEISFSQFETYEQALEAMNKAWNEAMPSGGLEEDYEDMSWSGDWGAALYRNGEDVLVWGVLKMENDTAERIVTDLTKRVVSDEPSMTRTDLACFLQERGMPEEDALGFADEIFEAVPQDGGDGRRKPAPEPGKGTRTEGGGSDV